MFGSKRGDRQNAAIKDSAHVVISGLIYGKTPSESMLSETYAANLKKHGLSSTKSFDLIELLNGTILHIQESHFLTAEQKATFRDQLGQTVNELRNPYGKTDYQLEEILDRTKKIKERLEDEQIDRKNVASLVSKVEEDLKKIKLAQARQPSESLLLKALIGFLGFTGKVFVYGIAFNSIAILSYVVYVYFNDPVLFASLLRG